MQDTIQINHYKSVDGWFDFENLYLNILKQSKDGNKLVEVGTFVGKSLCFLLEGASKLNKRVSIYAVDLFKLADDASFHGGSTPWRRETSIDECAKIEGEEFMFDKFKKNIENCPGKELLTIIRDYSWMAANQFENQSINFCFIDAGHTYDDVKKDIAAWYPKVVSGGILAGHDIVSKDIQRAIIEFCNEKKK